MASALNMIHDQAEIFFCLTFNPIGAQSFFGWLPLPERQLAKSQPPGYQNKSRCVLKSNDDVDKWRCSWCLSRHKITFMATS